MRCVPRSIVFDRLSSDEKFELFKVYKPNESYRQKSSLTCGICASLLYDPVVCQDGCPGRITACLVAS